MHSQQQAIAGEVPNAIMPTCMDTLPVERVSLILQEVLHALCDKNRKLPKRPSLNPPHGRTPPQELVTIMQSCWHQVHISLGSHKI